MKFKDLNDSELIHSYQRRVLSRPGSLGKRGKFLLHYTDINSVVSILQSGVIYLSSSANMNDSFEKILLDKKGIKNQLFYLCLSKGEESLAMYKMYQKDKRKSVVIKLAFSDIENIMSQALYGECKDGIDDIGKYIQHHRQVNIVRNDKLTIKKVWANLYCVEVLYLNPERNTLSNKSSVNKHIKFPLREQDLIGSVKYDCWSYEQEIRLCGFTRKPLKSNEKIALSLANDVCNNMVVVLGPDFDNNINQNSLTILREYGVKYTNSYYKDIYSGVL